MQYEDNPYALSLVNKNKPDGFMTTYGTSYMKVPTYEVSPAYEHEREPGNPGRWFPHDLSPYPSARDESPLRNKRPYQPMSYYEEDEMARRQRERQYRSRFEEATLRRDEYREPPPGNMHDYDKEQEYESLKRQHEQRSRPREKMQNARLHSLHGQYDDLVVDGQTVDEHDHRQSICNKCFKTNVCQNRLGCNHQFCDECMSMMPGSDGPFRDSIRWHYCCSACRKWTPESKLVRIDPLGRRMMKFHDIGYFKTS